MPARQLQGARSRRAHSQSLPSVLVIGAAIIGAALILRREGSAPIASASNEIVVGEYDTVSVPVPISYVPTGTKVKDIRFRTMSFPKHQIPVGALASVTEFLEAATIAPLPANLPLFKENLSVLAGAKNPVIERIPQGMRAMTIKVDATSSVEGWAGSGSIVDVLLVEKDRTTVIAEKVKVLSAERSVSPVEGASAPSVPNTVTVLVSQEQCLAINTAIPRGKIAFALRSLGDEERWMDTVYTAGRLNGGTTAAVEKSSISGFVSVQEQGRTSSFALTNGKWIQAETIPEGFFASRGH